MRKTATVAPSYDVIEAIVIDLYNEHRLDPIILNVIGRKFARCEPTSSSYVPLTDDDKQFHQVCIEMLEPEFHPYPTKMLKERYGKDGWREHLYYMEFRKLARTHWGWRGSI